MASDQTMQTLRETVHTACVLLKTALNSKSENVLRLSVQSAITMLQEAEAMAEAAPSNPPAAAPGPLRTAAHGTVGSTAAEPGGLAVNDDAHRRPLADAARAAEKLSTAWPAVEPRPSETYSSGPSTDQMSSMLARAQLRSMPVAYAEPARGAASPRVSSGSADEHVWTEVMQFPDPSNNWHGRKCLRCNARQHYGKQWGSNKYPGFSPVDPKCKGVPQSN